MHHNKLTVLLVGTLCLLPACSQDLKLKRLEAELMAAKNQGEMNVKSHELSLHMEEKLKKLEERIAGSLESSELELFEKSNAAWRSYFDVEVDFEASWYEGGTMKPMMANATATRLIEERINAIAERDPRGHR